MSSGCNVCPRNCRADRSYERGFCRESDVIRGARASIHMWEEPCISGSRGSGTVFFTGCNLRCVFCQNSSVASGKVGKEISPERLAEIFFELKDQGANNINLVTPTHFAPQIAKAIARAKQQGLELPVLYNCGGYESVDTLKSLEGLVDIYLPDMKYRSKVAAEKYSAAPDYFEAASAALTEMVRQHPVAEFVREGRCDEVIGAGEYQERSLSEESDVYVMNRGVIVRHMVLPGLTDDSCDIIRYLLDTYADRIFISIMSQYTPMPGIEKKFPELGRRVSKAEYDRVVDFAIEQGIENGFIQEEEAAQESFIPVFDCRGI